MIPKEKAKELVNKYKYYVHGCVGSSMFTNTEYPEQILAQAKKCALIAVDEIIKALHDADTAYDLVLKIDYWQEVKEEINKINTQIN